MRYIGPGLLAAMTLAAAPAGALPPKGPGFAEVRAECSRCHSLHNIENSGGFSREDWKSFIVQMTDLERRPEHLEAVLDYLERFFPPVGQ